MCCSQEEVAWHHNTIHHSQNNQTPNISTKQWPYYIGVIGGDIKQALHSLCKFGILLIGKLRGIYELLFHDIQWQK